MAKEVELTEKEERFVRARFFRYYHSSMIEGPPRIGLREWGFFLFGAKGMLRPVTFDSDDALNEFLSLKVPRHSYYSSAYYRRPEKPMDSPEKGWMGADLIFDLDADGIPGAEGMGYEEQLKKVKEEMMRLYDVFLQEHLGFSDKELFLVFSGGRGYHIHIRSPRVLDMDGDERREIMDYVAGALQDFSELFPKRMFPRYRTVSFTYMLPDTDMGWKGMIKRVAMEILREMEEMTMAEAIEFMKGYGIRKDVAARIYDRLYGERRGYLRMLERRDMEVFRSKSERENFIKLVEKHLRNRYGVHPDLHVTQDTRRLIRLPMSLHGGTGFLVKPLKRDGLDDFVPTRDAVPELYSDDRVGVIMKKKEKMRMKGEEYELRGRVRVPEYLAIFLILSGRASILD